MARIDTSKVMGTYTSDFGVKFANVPIKAQKGAPKLDVLYEERPSALACSGSLPFKPRRLQVTFNDGRRLSYPVPTIADIQSYAELLKPSLVDGSIPGGGDDEAVCITLIGEQWGKVTPNAIGKLTFKKTPYTDIPNRGIKQNGIYDYASDLLDDISLTYQIEEAPSGLLTCQKAGLLNPSTDKGICSGGSDGVTPRHLIVKALGKDGNKYTNVIRNVVVSKIGDLKSVASQTADCAYCFGYVGEGISNFQNLIGQTIGG